jgi:transcriptional regulator with XRE-family HTH domain
MTREARERVRAWLLEELRVRRWTQVELAARVGVSQSAVAKWLAPVDAPISRLPTYASCVHLADALSLPASLVLEVAGIPGAQGDRSDADSLTPLQRKVIAMIAHIPDPMLELLYHQLVPMVDQHVQEQILNSLANQVRRDGSVTP